MYIRIAVISAIAGGLATGVVTLFVEPIGKYFDHFFNQDVMYKEVLYKGHGEGADIRISSLDDDFSTRKLFTYELKNCVLKIKAGNASIECDLITTTHKNEKFAGTIKGRGIANEGFAYITYWGEYSLLGTRWPGMVVIKLKPIGNLTGYWLTEDTLVKGKFAFGTVKLLR